MTRKVCVITGTRAEYGLLRLIMQGISEVPELKLQIIATGMHLSPEFGLTWREIEKDGFTISRKVEMLTSSDTPVGIAKSMGLGMIGFADALAELDPDLILVLGDRFEILSGVIAAMVARIPVAHIHGGEATEGSIDEAIRHSISKMSHLHFVAAEEYKYRVIQLGEAPEKVFMVGGLGVDNIKRLKLLNRSDLEDALGWSLGDKCLLVTFHPVTLETSTAQDQMAELLVALSELQDTQLIFTLPNADTDGRILISQIEDFVFHHNNARAFTSLGQLLYLSCINQVDGVVGNSSSGLAEVPSFRKGTINIGDRQRGRLQAASVLNCAPERGAVLLALEKLFSKSFQLSLANVTNPYGEGGATEKIVDVIRTCNLDNILKKKFHDLPCA
jgi:GDP/UDP-N,N'-diacetylbacillosamine 2-epimerase (hydrolysing)